MDFIFGEMLNQPDIPNTKISLQQYLEAIIEIMPGSFYVKNKNGVYIACNKVVLEKGNLQDKTSIIGKTDFDIWPERAEEIRKNDLEVMERGITAELEETVILPDGKKMYFASVKSPLRDKNNQIVGVVCNSLDITEIKEAKKKAELSDAKTEFLENMRHDLRTPLTGIVGFANLLHDEITDPKLKEYATCLVASSNALMEFLNEILEMIKLNQDETPISQKAFNLKDKLYQITQLNQAKAQKNQLTLTFDYACDESTLYFLGDEKRLQRILLELVNNALNFTKKGRVIVNVTAENPANDNKRIIKLTVSDTGIGIPAEKQKEIFLQFSRVHPSYQNLYKGIGLGLAIVKKYIEDLNGEIHVESQIGKGSCFTCLIPMEITTDISSLPKPAHTGQKTDKISNLQATNLASPEKQHILVVEDDPLAAKVVQHLLSNLNCKVDLAMNGENAIELFKTHFYNMIFMDIGLPTIDGYETTRQIRQLERNQNYKIPILALTAHVDHQNKQHCIEAGMNAVLSKPLYKEKAEDVLKAMIPQKSEQKNTMQKELPLTFVEKTINSEKIKTIIGDETLVLELLEIFVNTLNKESENLTSAHNNQDWNTIGAIAHKLKSSASYCGADRLQAIASNLAQNTQNSIFYELLLTEINNVQQVIIAKNF